ncbi:MAG: spermidine/putrescine transport system permease protein, partial [Pseudonocardiales bacterium]|nr:spermidine/putrescine transport system permease protein [Pseudonocardiales bacterium]
MTTVLSPAPVQPPKPPRSRTKLGDRLLLGYTWAVIVWLCLPIGVMILFGFNDVQGRYNNRWHGFTLEWYAHVFDLSGLTNALKASVIIAVVSTLIATALGTLLGVALGRYRFRGAGTSNLVQFAAISTPEIVMGMSLVTFFVQLDIPLGYLTIIIAHVMFSLSFVAVTVRSRVLTLDRSVEEAAKDLGASAAGTFWLVTLPMILPGVTAGALLAFAISIDDFVVTNFTAGNVETFPLWIW